MVNSQLSVLAAAAPRRDVLLDPTAWAEQTFGTVALGDRRRTRRLVCTATALAADAAGSWPERLRNPAALKALYRLLDREAVTFAGLVAPHQAQTRTAATAEPVVLLVQDTTEIDYTPHPKTTGLAPIGNGRGRGFHLQTVLAVRPEPRQVLGILHAAPWLREPAPRRPDGTRETSAERRDRPCESAVWAAAAQAIGPPPEGSCWVHVADRGADIFAFLTACREQGAEVLVRSVQDRRVRGTDGRRTQLGPAIRACPVQATAPLSVPPRPGRPGRETTVALAWTTLTLLPPAGVPVAAPPPALPVWVVRVWEPEPPPAGEALEWVLLTTVPTASAADAWERVRWYRCRWLVEDFHHGLKTGCRLEAAQLRTRERLWRLLGLLMPQAVRLLQAREVTRTAPDTPVAAVMDATTVRLVAARTGQSPATTAGHFWRQVARLGGHQGRSGDGPPGWQTLWRGWRYVATLREGMAWAAALDDP